MSFLELRDLAKSFGEDEVLSGVTLSVEEGEVLALLGPSGSGKTTLLRLVAGFEQVDRGEILVGDQDVVPVRPAQRGFGMVFQHYALFPHMTVVENVEFGLDGWGLPPERLRERVAEVLELVDLGGFEERSVTRISGGQQQRVALARALAPKPRLLLLDEPLSNLDPELRERTRTRLRETLRRVGITTLLVTHEQEEAFDLGDRVAVLYQGRLQQVDRPEALYRAPATRFVASFVGRATLLEGVSRGGGEVLVSSVEGGPDIVWRGEPAGWTPANGDAVAFAVRPEALRLATPESAAGLPGRIVGRRFTGMVTLVTVELAMGGRIEVATREDVEIDRKVAVELGSTGPTPRIFPRARDAEVASDGSEDS